MSELIVAKSNQLIESCIFNATELELQVLNYAVAKLNPKWDNNGIIFKVTVSELVNTFGMKSKDAYRLYKKALSRLMQRRYTVKLENGKDWTENLVIGYGGPKDKSYLEFKFNEHISTHLSNLKTLFTSYNIQNVAKFKSRYSFILYEAFKMRLEKNHALNQQYWVGEINIQKLRENLSLTTKYKLFRDLRISVFDKAKSEINAYSDILLDFEIKKIGRTPTSIIFKVKHKVDKEFNTNRKKRLSKMEQALSQKEINDRKKSISNLSKEALINLMEDRKKIQESKKKVGQLSVTEEGIENTNQETRKSPEFDQKKQDKTKKGFFKWILGY